jgi:iron complex outermembrane receptor protein
VWDYEAGWKATLLNGHLRTQLGGVPTNPPVCFNYGPYLQNDLSGPNLYSPRWTFNAGLDYRFDLAAGVTLTPRLNYAYVGSQFSSLSYSYQTDHLPSRGLLSALLTLQLPRNWSVEAYGTNLTDKTYVSGQFGNNEFFGAPRQYGLRVGARF